MLSRGVRQRALVQQQRRAFSIGKRFERSTINEARKLEDGARVAVGGWVKSVRKHKSVNFVNVNDGSCLAEMQITLPAATAAGGGDGSSEESSGGASDALGVDIADITVGSSVFVEGVLREVPGGKQKRMELHPDKVDLLGKCDAQVYPLQKKYHSLEFLRENLHLRARTNTFGAVTRVRNALRFVHQFTRFRSLGVMHLVVADRGCMLFRSIPVKDFTRTSKTMTSCSSIARS